MGLKDCQILLYQQQDKERALIYCKFFKTAPGQYGEGDQFLGVTVPKLRKLAKAHWDLSYPEIATLLDSPYHEERLLGLLILTYKLNKQPNENKNIYRFYIKQLPSVNNWDLVDLSAPALVGNFLYESKNIKPLIQWANSRNLWKKRIAIVSTFSFIREGWLAPTYQITRLLMDDDHDLIHKASGWMLREAGKRDEKSLRLFIEKHGSKMPRTMLRYAIERFPPKERKAILIKTKS